jgi:hypothetical protein
MDFIARPVSTLALGITLFGMHILVHTLLEASLTQKTINFPVVSSSSKPQKLKQTRFSFAATKIMKTQQERLREMVIRVLGMTIAHDHVDAAMFI